MIEEQRSNKAIINEIIGRCLQEIEEKTGSILDARINGRMVSIYEDHPENSNIVSLEGIEEIILSTLKFENPDTLRCKNRKREYSDARSIFCHIARKYHFTLSSMGRFLSKDHTTIIHHVKKGRLLLEIDPVFSVKYNRVLQKMNNKYGEITF